MPAPEHLVTPAQPQRHTRMKHKLDPDQRELLIAALLIIAILTALYLL